MGLLVSPSIATVTFTSATRTLRAVAANTSEPAVTDSVSGFAPYDNLIQSQNPTINEPPGTFQQASAEQHSTFSSDSLAFSGRVFGVDHAVSSGSGNCVGTSTLTLAFDLSTTTPWSASYLNTFNPSPMSPTDVFGAGMTLRNTANVTFAAFDGFFASSPQGGVLPAGSYVLTLTINAGHGFTGTGAVGVNYNWAVSIPAPAAGGLLCLAPLVIRRRRG